MTTTTVIAGIGRLITNDPTHDTGLTGTLTDAWIAVSDGLIEAVGTGATPSADDGLDVAGRCVLPGFVDSHSHLVFAGNRSAEFAARMAGTSYAAGGILTTVEATRAAADDALARNATALRDEAMRSGTTTIEIKSGYGLTTVDELRLLRIAAAITSETTFLGAHVVPPEFADRVDDYVHLVCTEMLEACAPTARWIDVFCEHGAFDADQARAILRAGQAVGLGARMHANQLGHGPGAQLAVETNCASADHCTHLSDADVEALAGSTTVATFLPATDFSTRQPYPNARRLLDAGGTVALACNCNPGSSFTTSMGFVLALAVREMGMTIDEAVWAATAGGATALRRTDIGIIRPGARADLQILRGDHPIDVVYRPGVPAVAEVWVGGRRQWRTSD